MKVLIILSALVACTYAGYLGAPALPAVTYAAPAVAVVRPHIPHTQYRSQDTLGQYNYGYATGNGIAKSEARGADGTVVGHYGYTAPDGQRIETSYSAGVGGFRAAGNAIPVPVGPTPAVAAATAAHLTAHANAAVAAAAPVAYAAPAFAAAAPVAYAAPAVGYAAHYAAPAVGYAAHYAAPGVAYGAHLGGFHYKIHA